MKTAIEILGTDFTEKLPILTEGAQQSYELTVEQLERFARRASLDITPDEDFCGVCLHAPHAIGECVECKCTVGRRKSGVVRVGDVWRSNDPRDRGKRLVDVVGIYPDHGVAYQSRDRRVRRRIVKGCLRYTKSEADFLRRFTLVSRAGEARLGGGSRATIPDSANPVLCEHANEVPMACSCVPNCYCKDNTCSPTGWRSR